MAVDNLGVQLVQMVREVLDGCRACRNPAHASLDVRLPGGVPVHGRGANAYGLDPIGESDTDFAWLVLDSGPLVAP